MRAQDRKETFRGLRQQPWQRHFDAQRIVEDVDLGRRGLTERTHQEAQRISVPGRLFHRDHRTQRAFPAGEALFYAPDRLRLPETMADDDGDCFAQGYRDRGA